MRPHGYNFLACPWRARCRTPTRPAGAVLHDQLTKLFYPVVKNLGGFEYFMARVLYPTFFWSEAAVSLMRGSPNGAMGTPLGGG